MGILSYIVDGLGSGRRASIDKNNSLVVTNTGMPPENINATLKPFVSFFKDASGASDMLVDGSVTEKEFFIGSSSQGDRFVHTLAFTISDAVPKFNKWGAATALTNGCQLIYENNEVGDVIIGDSLTSNFDFVQLCNFNPMFGTGADAFQATNIFSTSEAYIPLMDIEDVLGMPHGLRIPKDSNLRLKLVIRDDVSLIDRFDIKAFGYDRVENE